MTDGPTPGTGRDPAAGAWYREGLKFACTGCGDCCHGEGYVWVSEARAGRIASHLGLDLEEFGRRYLRRVGDRLSLVDGPGAACVFWHDGCSIYPVRPRQCRTFPFWGEHLESPKSWRLAACLCEGIGDGETYAAPEIERLLAGRGATREHAG